jgi:hypothetical protein
MIARVPHVQVGAVDGDDEQALPACSGRTDRGRGSAQQTDTQAAAGVPQPGRGLNQ